MSDLEWAVVREAMPVPGRLDGRGGQPESRRHRQMADAVRHLVAGGITREAVRANFSAEDRVNASGTDPKRKGASRSRPRLAVHAQRSLRR
ncbi:hypothetical protein ACF1BN_21785 [Streptomyces sp. NPDC014861]|uniref:hypothetical protein n=1 Tax=Streptomyces sp. NPDC014861 TaxID=3364923 RepID=UPI0036F9855C